MHCSNAMTTNIAEFYYMPNTMILEKEESAVSI